MKTFERFRFIPVSVSYIGARKALTDSAAVLTDDDIETFPADNVQFKEIVPNIWVDAGPLFTDITAEYLETDIKNKKVYAPLVGYPSGLPCGHIPYIVSAAVMPKENLDGRIPVIFSDEKTLGDLYKNAWKYAYIPETGSYMRLAEKGAEQNLIKCLLARRVVRYGGHPFDRLADYGRLILFLLSKISLTNEEKKLVGDLLDYVPDPQSLADVAEREATIQKTVAKAKTDPAAFLGVNHD